MKARILNNKFQGIYTNDFIQYNLQNFINGQLVSEWQLTEVLPSEELIKPMWNGTEWIEGATAEEIAEANRPIVPEVVSRRQFKIALAVLGYQESDIFNGIERLPEPNKTIARISYLESVTFERYSSDLIFVATNFLGLSSDQIDEVFLTANTF